MDVIMFQSLAIDLPIDEISNYCQQKPIYQLALFGSVLRDDFNAASDIDVLVVYDPDAKITLIDMAQQEIELGQIIGRKVDLQTAEDLQPDFRTDVLAKAVIIYELTNTPE